MYRQKLLWSWWSVSFCWQRVCTCLCHGVYWSRRLQWQLGRHVSSWNGQLARLGKQILLQIPYHWQCPKWRPASWRRETKVISGISSCLSWLIMLQLNLGLLYVCQCSASLMSDWCCQSCLLVPGSFLWCIFTLTSSPHRRHGWALISAARMAACLVCCMAGWTCYTLSFFGALEHTHPRRSLKELEGFNATLLALANQPPQVHYDSGAEQGASMTRSALMKCKIMLHIYMLTAWLPSYTSIATPIASSAVKTATAPLQTQSWAGAVSLPSSLPCHTHKS